MPQLLDFTHLEELIAYLVGARLLERRLTHDFRMFVRDGEADEAFLSQLDSDEKLQEAVEIALAWQDELLKARSCSTSAGAAAAKAPAAHEAEAACR